jgi:putative membrane-bound dehydrogenase-like protein
MLRACFLLLLLAGPLYAQKQFGFDNTKGSGQPYLLPEETVKRFQVPAEFEVKLFAGEPKLTNPIAFTIDEKGRVWCVESFEYPKRTPKGKAPRDRIVILEDTDGDGVADKRTVFAEGKDFPVMEERKKAGLGAFDMASGIEVGHGGVYLGAPPYLYFIENKDDKPGKFEVLLKGFGSEDTHETLNTFQWGPDGWLYGLHGVFTFSTVKSLDGAETRMNAAVWRLNPKTKKFEIFSEGTSNPWGMDWRNTDGQFILACCVIPHLYHMVPGGIYQRQAGASYNPYAYSYIKEISDHTFHKESGWAHAGLISLDVPHMPERFRNSVIFGSIHGCSLKQNILRPNGSSYIGSRGDDFLTSGDKNFRPINLKWGPNGDIYLIDWHDQNPCHQTKPDQWDYERGRVYRIQLKGTKPKKAEDLSKKSDAELQKLLLEDHNPWVYRSALRLLNERQAESQRKDIMSRIPRPMKRDEIFQAADNAAESTDPAKGLRGVWLTSIYATDVDFTNSKLIPEVRAAKLRLLSNTTNFNAPPGFNGFSNVATEKSILVRRELASFAARHPESNFVPEILKGLMSHTEDAQDPLIPNLVWIAYEKIISKKTGANNPAIKELAWLAEQAPTNIFVRDQIVPKVMRRLVATGQKEDLELCLKFIQDVKDLNSREKALDGLVIALANQTVDAPASWKALQSELRQQAKLTPLVNKLSVNFRDSEAMDRAFGQYHTGKSTSERIQGLRDLVTLKHPQAAVIVEQSLFNDKELSLLQESARQVGNVMSEKLAFTILKDWRLINPQVQGDVINSLSTRKESARLLLLSLQSKGISSSLVSDNVITRIQAFNDKELNALIEKAWGRTRPSPKELDDLINKMRGELRTGSGNFAKGKLVFEAQCAKCHKFEGKGQEVGPALEGAGRDVEYILTNVIDPNRVIGAPYFQRIVKTEDGRVEQGLLVEEDELSITLKVEQGVKKRFLKKDLEGPVRILEKSMMPEGLTAGMSVQDFRDLVTYLMVHPVLSKVSVNGESVQVPVLGGIPIPKGKDTATVEASLVVSDATKTILQLSGKGSFELFLNGERVHQGQLTAETQNLEVSLPQGALKLKIQLKQPGEVLFARFLDPERRLRAE